MSTKRVRAWPWPMLISSMAWLPLKRALARMTLRYTSWGVPSLRSATFRPPATFRSMARDAMSVRKPGLSSTSAVASNSAIFVCHENQQFSSRSSASQPDSPQRRITSAMASGPPVRSRYASSSAEVTPLVSRACSDNFESGNEPSRASLGLIRTGSARPSVIWMRAAASQRNGLPVAAHTHAKLPKQVDGSASVCRYFNHR
jgi:hypothetical protein